MRKNKQLVVDLGRGDCFRACLTSILDIPNSLELPNVDNENWFTLWSNFLNQFGLNIRWNDKSCWQEGYWIATVKSKNFKGVLHAIVMHNIHYVYFDPSTKKRYRTGRDLLKQHKLVIGGYSLYVIDASKLHLLKEYRESINA